MQRQLPYLNAKAIEGEMPLLQLHQLHLRLRRGTQPEAQAQARATVRYPSPPVSGLGGGGEGGGDERTSGGSGQDGVHIRKTELSKIYD